MRTQIERNVLTGLVIEETVLDVCFMHRMYWNEEESEKQMVLRGCMC